ncbi:MAG: T9SS type A sorting domain-containing protein [Bacteroidota bacterium]
MVLRLLLLACLYALAWALPEATAQPVGTCSLGSSSADLDANNVRARLYNNGGFFWRGSGNVYTVPKGGQANSIFAAGLWLGGMADDGTHRFAGTAYGPWEFWPGPLDENGSPPDDCADYDRMYSVYDADIRAYEHDGTLTDDLRDWPHHLGAPVVDGDGIEGNYDLAAGDRPHVYGEQSVWWVMNDAGNTKQWSATPPIGLELQMQAFSARCVPDFGAETDLANFAAKALNHTTYYHFKFIHKGQDVLRDAYLGWWSDGDLGNAANDFVGVDTLLDMGFYYNGEDFDAGLDGYGDRPPALGMLLTKGLDGRSDGRDNDSDGVIDEADERLGFTNMVFYTSDSTPQGNFSSSTIEPYNYLRSIWRDGQPVTFGGTGYGGLETTKYMFPGDPVTAQYWSEENTDGRGNRNTPADRRFLLSSGPIDFAPGDTTEAVLAIVWAQDANRLASVVKLRRAAAAARGATDALMQYGFCTPPAEPPEPEQPDPNALGFYILRQNYPEPFSQQTIIRYEVIDTVPVTLTVYDLLGRRVRTLVDGMQSAGVYDVVFEAGDLPTGLYFYRLEAAGYVSITRRMTLQR